MNKLYYGDNLEILRRDIDKNSIDLCYIDPPFNSKRNYNQIYNNIGQEDKAQPQAFVDTWEWDEYAEDGFNQILGNANNAFTKQNIELILGLSKVLGKGSLLAYLVHMTLRIAEIYRVLKPTGSFYLHCDPTASHYLKLVIDTIFCSKGGDFRNEIIWHYPGRERLSNYKFQSKHDIIFFYSKTDGTKINPITKKWDKKDRIKMLRRKIHTDENGKEWFWETRGQANGVEKYKKFLDEYLDKGGALNDVWDDIQFLRGNHPERMGYPTQKPAELLERIIRASSKEGDIILDAYCGCGTSVAAAQNLNRKWIGIDITYQSISLILKRLSETFGEAVLDNIELNGIPKDIASAVALANKKDDRTRKEFEKWAVLTYSNNKALINEKKGADHGIDGIAYIMEGADLFRDVLFSVKSGHSSLSHFRDFCHVVTRDKAAIGIYLTLDEPTKPMRTEATKMGKYINPLTEQEFDKVNIVTVRQILDGERLNIPTSVNVLKKAELTKNNNQHKLDF